MQINKIQSPNFGRCELHTSTSKVLETLSDSSITELFEQADRIRNTKRWDLFIKGHFKSQKPKFYMYFIDKYNRPENGFTVGLIPFAREGNIVKAIAPDANPYSSFDTIYHFPFENKKRAKEVCEFLNKPAPETNMDIFKRAIETIKIMEESNDYSEMISNADNKKGFFDKFLSFIGLKK